MLARIFEASGLSTVIVTMMPYWSERIGAPRTLAVEFPLGHPIGWPGDREMQMTVCRAAVQLLEEAAGPGEIRHLEGLTWPQEPDEARRDWQPPEPAPIIRLIRERLRALREAQEGGGGGPR